MKETKPLTAAPAHTQKEYLLPFQGDTFYTAISTSRIEPPKSALNVT